MTLRFTTSDPMSLLENFKNLIKQTEPKGKIKSWIAIDGGFRHNSDWKDKCLFQAVISADKTCLIFTTSQIKEEFAYAYYHGHLLQTFIEHLNTKFTGVNFFDGRKK
ncbi:hypothetical protein ALP39_200480 [Pseudomonas marginalis pv. marginalis]|uniref:hypothetical protein n=1 Tax=Pseudomonas fluorescens TaxID=294 RepID=UPI000F006767|nr:hypothetical protein [Pseudomonas fluorescens]MBD8239512.1 hypothetical protein [Pseudomonas fluorescens]MDY0898443.1 hypothetical protein [Pseudomonas fluorescens]RMT95148.1 hypothetical protein ALP39_200480 [Pseudomonas marginalis pv. marginalis]